MEKKIKKDFIRNLSVNCSAETRPKYCQKEFSFCCVACNLIEDCLQERDRLIANYKREGERVPQNVILKPCTQEDLDEEEVCDHAF